MNCSKMMRLLLVWIAACTGGLSCKPSESQAVLQERKVQNDRTVLSKQEMIAIAAKASSRYGRDPNKWGPVIDKGNVEWRDFAFRRHYKPHYENLHLVWPVVKDDELDAAIAADYPMLKDHDYQALWYEYLPPEPSFGFDMNLCILIDRHTGEILAVLGAFGQVVSPQG